MINNLGIVYFSMKDYVQARRFFDATLMQDPNNEKALYNRAKCYNALEEY
jgi:Tfp pilus assembly protein PilF